MYCTMLYLLIRVQGKTRDKKRNDKNLIVNLDQQAYSLYQMKERRNLFLPVP